MKGGFGVKKRLISLKRVAILVSTVNVKRDKREKQST